jgi:cell division protein FtsZ
MDPHHDLQNNIATNLSTELPNFAFVNNKLSSEIPKGNLPPIESKKSAEDITLDIKFGVLAVGGAGGNILTKNATCLPYINRTIAIDSDPNALHHVIANKKILVSIDEDYTNTTDIALSVANIHEIIDAVSGLDIVFIVAGMGGITGTSSSPIIAEILRNHEIDVLGVAIMPFDFEGEQRQNIAISGVKTLRHQINGVFQISNEAFAKVADKSRPTEPLLKYASLAFAQFYKCITDASAKPGIIGIDFADVRNFIGLQGDSAFGYGAAKGSNSVEMAVQQAIDHPLLGQHKLKLTSGVLIAFELRYPIQDIHEIYRGFTFFRAQLQPDTDIWWSAVLNPDLSDDYRVTIMLSGI